MRCVDEVGGDWTDVVFEWSILDAIVGASAVSSKSGHRIEDDGVLEVARIQSLVPIWLRAVVVAFGSEGFVMVVYDVAVPRKKSSLCRVCEIKCMETGGI